MFKFLWGLILKLFQLVGLLILAAVGFSVFSAIGGFEVIKQFTRMDSCRQYSDYTCDQLENMPYHVYFYYPNGQEYYLGRSESLPMCGARARSQAARTNMSYNTGWDYICCLEAKGSNCLEKHR